MIVFITILSAFAIIGIVTVVKALIYEDVPAKKIIVYSLNDENNIEYVIRSLRNSFPNAEIEVNDLGSEDLTEEIAKRL